MNIKLELENISKEFQTVESKQKLIVLNNINLKIYDGELISFIGPSGCGKTTLLKIIAGLVSPSKGRVLLEGKEVKGPGAERGVVFQDDAIFLWRRVIGNVEYGLEIKKIEKGERRKIALGFLKMVNLEKFANFFPKELSGGMKKRVALATVFANNPEVLLMDEPFGALDYQTKCDLQKSLLEIWEKQKKTTVFITHDIEEAIFLSDRIVVFGIGGKIKSIYEVNLPRPRDDKLRISKEFNEAKNEVWEIFGGE